MKNRETYDTYSGISVSREVREFLTESTKEHKRQRDREYQYGTTDHAFDVEERQPYDKGGATCDPIYAVTQAHNQSAEKVFFQHEAHKALNKALAELSTSARRRLLLHFYNGLSFTEIARREGVSESAVRGQIKSALSQLRHTLEAQNISLSDFGRRSVYDYLPVLTRNGQKQRGKEKEQKKELAQGSGDEDVA
jgi:RNA polymerase sigma factor (sigma-70 family)